MAEEFDYRKDLGCYFGLSHNTFAVLTRVLMEAMPAEWQEKMAVLLHEYDDTWNNWPEGSGCRVHYTMNGKLAKMPDWLLSYRHPDYAEIDRLRGRSYSDQTTP